MVGNGYRTVKTAGETDTVPTVITKLLNEYRITFLKDNDLFYDYRRIKAGRRIVLARGDGVDSGDSDFGIPPKACPADTAAPLSEAESGG